MESTNENVGQVAVAKFIKCSMAKPSKRYPVYVWKVHSIYPMDICKMFWRWKNQSSYNNIRLFMDEDKLLELLFEGFDRFGLNWHVKAAYGREKIYFGNLRLKWYGCQLLVDVGARTYLGGNIFKKNKIEYPRTQTEDTPF